MVKMRKYQSFPELDLLLLSSCPQQSPYEPDVFKGSLVTGRWLSSDGYLVNGNGLIGRVGKG